MKKAVILLLLATVTSIAQDREHDIRFHLGSTTFLKDGFNPLNLSGGASFYLRPYRRLYVGADMVYQKLNPTEDINSVYRDERGNLVETDYKYNMVGFGGGARYYLGTKGSWYLNAGYLFMASMGNKKIYPEKDAQSTGEQFTFHTMSGGVGYMVNKWQISPFVEVNGSYYSGIDNQGFQIKAGIVF